MKVQVSILIPLFGSELSIREVASLMSCNEHLNDFPITFIKGESNLNIESAMELCPSADFVSFDDRYFANRLNYTKLLLSEELYSQFGWSKYLLINELSSEIRKNELAYWCRQGFDYIQGVPPERAKETYMDKVSMRINPAQYVGEHKESLQVYETLNGLSLRLVETCWSFVKSNKRSIANFLNNTEDATNDSIFWEYYINRWWPQLTTPNDIARSRFVQLEELTQQPAKGSEPFASAHALIKRPLKA